MYLLRLHYLAAAETVFFIRSTEPNIAVSPPQECTQLLARLSEGDGAALDELWPFVYSELREIAHMRLSRNRPDAALNTTALVHEAYIRLTDGTALQLKDRGHFLALAARAMRFILVDHARALYAGKRGSGRRAVTIDGIQIAADDRAEDLLTLNLALEALTEYDERLGSLVEMRFFGGLSYDEIAAVTGRSVPTVKRDWARARTWLYKLMQSDRDNVTPS